MHFHLSGYLFFSLLMQENPGVQLDRGNPRKTSDRSKELALGIFMGFRRRLSSPSEDFRFLSMLDSAPPISQGSLSAIDRGSFKTFVESAC